MNSYARKATLPPGTLVYTGTEAPIAKPTITVFVYTEDFLHEQETETIEAAIALRKKGCALWININGLTEVEHVEAVGAHCNIHQLVLEDILHVSQRPKCEDYGDYLFIVTKMLGLENTVSEKLKVTTEQVSFLLGKDYVITFQERPGDVFDAVRNRLRLAKGQVRKMGADYLAYALMDAIVDQYFMILEQIGEETEAIEASLVDDPSEAIMQRIHTMKRLIIFLRRTIWPLREAVSTMERGESALIHKRVKIYFRDLYDHTIQVMDMVESLRDIVSGMLDTYLSSMSNRMNSVMKVLTIIATIFIPLTFIAGIYGMNFEYMPELHHPWAYPITLLAMLGVLIGMLVFFRRKRWI